MPYIKPEKRDRIVVEFDETGATIDSSGIHDAGDLNYAVTVLAVEFLRRNSLKYQTINDIMGALEGAKQEFYRRVVVPYEDDKAIKNGEVYTLED